MQSPASFLQRHLDDGFAPSIQYRFFSPDSMLFKYDGGLADVAEGITATSATVYNGFSVTKTFTALAILRLVDEGLVDLDNPAAQYLPEFPYSHDITVRHLLTHSGGLPNPIPLSWIHLEEERNAFRRDVFFREQFGRARKVKGRPNDRFAYSNLGYVLLGQLVEQVSGMPYEQYVEERIFSSLGTTTHELGFDIDPQVQAKGYHKRGTVSYWMLGLFLDRSKYIGRNEQGWMAFRPYYVNGASYGGIRGTADGFARYIQALLTEDSSIVSRESKQLLFTENVLSGSKPSGMGLSWFKGELDGHAYFAHAGGGGGYYAEIRIYPKLRRGSVVLLNRSGMRDARFLDKVDRHAIRIDRKTRAPSRSST